MSKAIPTIALVGRTNVGKSTLFNRLIEEQKSLVSRTAGTTRDRFEGRCIWRGKEVRIVDTGGLDIKSNDVLNVETIKQAHLAIKDADVLVFIVDAQTIPQTADRELALEFLKSKKPLIFAANKADNGRIRASLQGEEWVRFPLKNPFPLSARQGKGAGDLLDEAFRLLEEAGKPAVSIVDHESTRVAVIGRPNVGKSTLLNHIVGEERFIASDIEHTTRGPNDILVEKNGKKYTFVDTAGIRKMARIKAGDSKLELSGVDHSLRAMKQADVILFVIDISKAIKHQDKFLAGEIDQAGKSVVIIANKWDLIPDKETNTINKYEDYIRDKFPGLSYAPIIFTSALSGKRVNTIFEMIDELYRARFIELTPEQTKEFISRAIMAHKPSRGTGVAHPKITHFKQIRVNPPVFELGIKQLRRDNIADSYLRFLKNQLRSYYQFIGTPIIIRVSPRKKSHTT